jgi:hypothetical protein
MTTLTQAEWLAGLKSLTMAYARWDEAPVDVTLPDGSVTTVLARTPDLTQAGLLAEARMRSLFGEQPYKGPAVVLIEAIDMAIIGSLGGSVLAALGLTATQAKAGVAEIKTILNAMGVGAPTSIAGILGALAGLHMPKASDILRGVGAALNMAADDVDAALVDGVITTEEDIKIVMDSITAGGAKVFGADPAATKLIAAVVTLIEGGLSLVIKPAAPKS